MNLGETKSPKDMDYREIRLDKNVPIVDSNEEYISAYCPNGKSTCNLENIILSKYHKSNNFFLYLTIIFLILIVVMLIVIIKKHN